MIGTEYRVRERVGDYFDIIEVEYGEDGKVSSYWCFPSPEGDTIEDLMEDLEKMKEALSKPVVPFIEWNQASRNLYL